MEGEGDGGRSGSGSGRSRGVAERREIERGGGGVGSHGRGRREGRRVPPAPTSGNRLSLYPLVVGYTRGLGGTNDKVFT